MEEEKDAMEMGTTEAIDNIEPRGEIYACPACGYTDGFHVSFRLVDRGSTGEIYLICPSCHRRFRIGWQVQMAS